MRRSRRPWPLTRLIALTVIVGVVLIAAGWWHRRQHAAPAPVTDDRIQQAISVKAAQQALADALPADQFSGVAAIFHDGKRIATLTRGQADRKRHIKNTPATLFEIDSVQKSLTAGLIMREVVAGKLDLYTHLSRYYPQVPGAQQITLRQMLDMTSGLSFHGAYIDRTYTSDAERIRRLIPHLRFSQRQYNHGVYQPATYNLLAGILEQVTHKSYHELFTSTYTDELGLHHTRFAYAKKRTGMAQGYGWGPDGISDAPLVKTSAAVAHQELGTGQVFMNVDDLYHAESALLSGPLLDARPSAWLFAPGSMTTYGGGLYQLPQYRFANGFGYGFQCFLRITQNGQDAVIVLVNCNTPNHLVQTAADQLAQQWLK